MNKAIKKHYSEISKRGWAKLTPEQRSERARKASANNWNKLTTEQKKEKIEQLRIGRERYNKKLTKTVKYNIGKAITKN